ncbi:DUF397 domain-containing protein [Actinoplanes sp. L3-i22]|uniref:DUF397 domain-containing protein n=1 Tax=Actinoplanes sp. L3-i22 TaxID=2836373 RepID=UPI001C74B72E|nr:DUF397 domain-containing protein [Actinoplanes sp. L3-i22]BCY07676.1 hypothetical protein L3i22_027640 [Actinoplanes sp. L3-i22]
MSDTPPAQPVWRKSSRCGHGNCVEVAVTGDTVLIRDSKDPSGGVVECDAVQWGHFLSAVRAGAFGA